MVGCLDFANLLHSVKKEDEDVIFACNKEMTCIHFKFDDFGKETNLAHWLMLSCIIYRELSLSLTFATFGDLGNIRNIF